jgi:Zn-dependent protease with chaperone function
MAPIGDRHGAWGRFTCATGSLFGSIFQILLVVAVLGFALATCSGRMKSTLGCLGLVHEEKAPTLKIRSVDMSNPDDARLVTALGLMTDAAGIRRDTVRLAVAVDKSVNAAAIDSHSFLLFEGLKEAPTIVLEAIMAHEAAHATRQHSESASRFAKTVEGATHVLGGLVGASSDGRREAAKWATGLAVPAHSREQEFEADGVAVEVLDKAGYATDATDVMLTALEFLAGLNGGSEGGLLDTHPALNDRIQRIRSKRSPDPTPWEMLESGMRVIMADERVAPYLSEHKIALGQFSVKTMSYLNDADMLTLTSLKAKIVDGASEPICGAFFLKNDSALRPAVNHLDSASVTAWLRIIRTGVDAQLRGRPPRVVSKQQVKTAYAEIMERLPAEDASRYLALSKQKNPELADLCWGARTLLKGIVSLPDREAAAQLSFAIAGYGPAKSEKVDNAQP